MGEPTPGPWTFSNGAFPRIMVKGGDSVAGVHRNGSHAGRFSEAEFIANGNLLAAAPDLLAAARRALAILKATGESVRPGNALGALEAAIAKASPTERGAS